MEIPFEGIRPVGVDHFVDIVCDRAEIPPLHIGVHIEYGHDVILGQCHGQGAAAEVRRHSIKSSPG